MSEKRKVRGLEIEFSETVTKKLKAKIFFPKERKHEALELVAIDAPSEIICALEFDHVNSCVVFLGWKPDEVKRAKENFKTFVIDTIKEVIKPPKKEVKQQPKRLIDALGESKRLDVAIMGMNCRGCAHHKSLSEPCTVDDQELYDNLEISDNVVYCGCYQERAGE